MPAYDLIAILGPTASGKTPFAAALAAELHSEVVSADSRQVYRGMDIGTGKDLADYTVGGVQVPYHLIDIVEPGYKYNVFEYQRDFRKVYDEMRRRGCLPILCGGTGMYLEAVLKGYDLPPVPENKELRRSLEGKSLEELTEILRSYKTLHNTTDVDTPKRAIRAIEIAMAAPLNPPKGGTPETDNEFYKSYKSYKSHKTQAESPPFGGIEGGSNSLIIGIDIDREERRRKITRRLQQRLESGMVEEVRRLLQSGIAADDLIYYGLEYKYVTLYAIGRLTYEEMFRQLEIAIHQFAKRQMTWFRGMERRGLTIHWIKADCPTTEKIQYVKDLLNRG